MEEAVIPLLPNNKCSKFQTCLQNVNKAVWDLSLCEMAASVKSEKILKIYHISPGPF